MNTRDLQHIAFLIGKEEPSIIKDYLDQVANKALLEYRRHLQWGGKEGESLYVHVLNGVFVLETLRPHLSLTDTETRVLFTAFTVHDLNKALGQELAFGKLATRENISGEIERLGLDHFFPEWRGYQSDIESLVRGHSGHHHSGGERLFVKRTDEYGLGLDRVNALLHLMRAADIIDLSHSLGEQAHKADFLGNINAFLADSGQARQFEFITHRLTEQRGLLTNVMHNVIIEDMHEQHGAIPLLYYPDGVAYLVKKGKSVRVDVSDLTRIGGEVAEAIGSMISAKFQEFILPRPAGIQIDAKCLELGVPFPHIWQEVYNIVQRRNPDPVELDAKARDWAQRGFKKASKAYPDQAEHVQAALDADNLLVSEDPARLRRAELVRTYYIFLNKHFREAVPDPWEHIYRLLELPESQWPYYAFFDALWARAYVLSKDLTLSEQEIYRRIEQDGEMITTADDSTEDPKTVLFSDYLRLYAVFGVGGQQVMSFNEHLAHYVENQHHQCIYCSGPFPTDKWMAADVRSDVTVQTFSNRLRGGPGEPKKYICAVCQIQFLLEKLNYPTVRDEKTLYLHLFPYSFLTGPFIEGLSNTIRRIVTEDSAVQALNMNVAQAMDEYVAEQVVTPTFRSRTKKDRPQPYGLYLPRYHETLGNLLIFPINPGGANDTERFLFVLWNALLLQRHFGVKVLMSDSAVPPLGKEEIPDLYVDNIPLACQGLLPHNDFSQFVNGSNKPGPLDALWTDVGHLFALRRLTFTSSDNTPRLVRALNDNPLTIFYETEKLLEAKMRRQSQEAGGLLTWLFQQSYPHVQSLAQSKGGSFMAELSVHLRQLAELAWQNGLRGRSLEKSSLLHPLGEVFQKLNYAGGVADLETLKAAAAQDIFDHLSRIADDRYKPGRKKTEATRQFVDGWFDGVLVEVYSGNLRKLLNDEKLIRSAYHFYIREQIPKKDNRRAIEKD